MLLAYAVLVATVLPSWVVSLTGSKADENHRLDAIANARGALLGVLAPVVLGIGAVAALLNYRETSTQNRRTLELASRRQVTARFTRAIGQLGKVGRRNLHFRLGGIYALEQISQDSSELHWPVMEVLTAFLREGSKAPTDTTSGGAEIYKPPGPGHSTPRLIAADLEAAARVIARRPEERRQEESKNDRWLDLYRARLAGADFFCAHLQRAFLAGADLRGAILRRAHLEGATLGDAHLEEADLVEAHLETVDLYGAHLEGAQLRRAHLEGALLAGAHLEGADLTGAHLEGAHLDSEKSPGVDMPDASGLTREQLEQAFCDEKTRLPSYLAEPASEAGS